MAVAQNAHYAAFVREDGSTVDDHDRRSAVAVGSRVVRGRDGPMLPPLLYYPLTAAPGAWVTCGL